MNKSQVIHLFKPHELVSYCDTKFSANTTMTIYPSKADCMNCLSIFKGRKVSFKAAKKGWEYRVNYWPELEEVELT